jgi:hypothetical protein
MTAALIVATATTVAAEGLIYRDNANARFVRDGLLETNLIFVEEALEIVATVRVVCTSGYIMSVEIQKATDYASDTAVTGLDLKNAKQYKSNGILADHFNNASSQEWKSEWNNICQIGKTLMGWQTIN